MTGQSDIDRVREATDLVGLIGEHIMLRPRGREHVGLCPFHDDRTPSLAVVTHKGNAFYKCHACGAAGDAFDFVQQYHRMEFVEALRYLAERAGITLQSRRDGAASGDQASGRDALHEANRLALSLFRRVLANDDAGRAGRQILSDRGISEEMIEAFQIGMAPDGWDGLLGVVRKRGMSEKSFVEAGLLKPRKTGDGLYDAFRNRLIFPICNELGQPIAFGARKIDPEDEPKYLNSAESPIFQKSRTLYGLNLAKRSIIDSRQAIVTEGYTDVIACHQAGITNVVGTLGTALTREHARLLGRLCDTVVLVFDGDEAGKRAADRGVEIFFSEPVDIRICVLPGGKDPDDLLREEDGAARFHRAVEEAEDALAYRVRRFRATLEAGEGISARQKKFEQFMREVSDLGFSRMQGVRKRWVVSQLADLLGVSADDVLQSIPAQRHRPQPAAMAHDQDHDEAGVSQPASSSTVWESKEAEAIRPVRPARRRAERELLALLVYEPTLRRHPLAGEDGGSATVAELFRPDQFADVPAREIARYVLAKCESDEGLTTQELMRAMEDEAARNLASMLFLEGERLAEAVPGEHAADRRFEVACRTLLEQMDREEYEQSVAAFRQRARGQVLEGSTDSQNTLEAANEVLAKRRRQRHLPAAISRGIRG